MGKFPSPASHDVALTDKLDEIQRTVKFQMKKVSCLCTPVGTVDLTQEQLQQNINLAINTLISLLKKGWQNIKSLHIKSSMGPVQRIF
jgi:large subunit ribosomal protein L10Ae